MKSLCERLALNVQARSSLNASVPQLSPLLFFDTEDVRRALVTYSCYLITNVLTLSLGTGGYHSLRNGTTLLSLSSGESRHNW